MFARCSRLSGHRRGARPWCSNRISSSKRYFPEVFCWDRMRYYVALNATLLGVGIGLLRLEGGAIGGRVLSLLVFIVGIIACPTRRHAGAEGEKDYHHA